MSIVVFEPITNAGLTQDITLTRSIHLRALRIGIMKHDTLDGDVIVSLYDGVTLLKSVTVEAADINALGTYANGFLAFEFDTFLGVVRTAGSKEYQIKVVYDGTESDTNYIGWNRAHENNIVLAYGSNQSGGEPVSDTYSPFEIELYRWG